MPLIEINHTPSRRELLRFVALLPLAGLVFGAAVWFWTRSTTAAIITAAVLAALGLLGLALPAVRRRLYLGWMYAFLPVGMVLGTLLLGAVYFVVVMPIGLLVRIFIGDPMTRRFERGAETYWRERGPAVAAARYFRQY
jgi:hypothetical protein